MIFIYVLTELNLSVIGMRATLSAFLQPEVNELYSLNSNIYLELKVNAWWGQTFASLAANLGSILVPQMVIGALQA